MFFNYNLSRKHTNQLSDKKNSTLCKNVLVQKVNNNKLIFQLKKSPKIQQRRFCARKQIITSQTARRACWSDVGTGNERIVTSQMRENGPGRVQYAIHKRV